MREFRTGDSKEIMESLQIGHFVFLALKFVNHLWPEMLQLIRDSQKTGTCSFNIILFYLQELPISKIVGTFLSKCEQN